MHAPALNNIDLKLLSVFMTVVRSGGFSLAQAELNISQSTISIHIGNLETRLSMKLCQRGKGGFALTEDGQRVYDATSALFVQLADYRAVVSGNDKLSGELQIAIIDNQLTHPTFKLHEIIGELGKLDHTLKVTVHATSPNRLERLVLNGEVHMAIGYFPRKLSQLTYELLYSAKMELFCGSKHSLFSKPEADICEADILSCQHAQRAYVSVDQTAEKHRSFNYSAGSDTADGLIYLVLSGHYLSFLPVHLAQKWVDQGVMKSVMPARYGYESDYHLIRQKSGSKTPAELKLYQLVVDFVHENCSQ